MKVSIATQKRFEALLLPDKIKVGPFIWRVKYVMPDDPALKRAWGLTSIDEHIITLSNPITYPGVTKYFEVALHELLHAIWSTGRDVNKKATEEDFAILGGLGLTALFTDNPKLLDWFNACVAAVKHERKGV